MSVPLEAARFQPKSSTERLFSAEGREIATVEAAPGGAIFETAETSEFNTMSDFEFRFEAECPGAAQTVEIPRGKV